jgi:hypothetical protein
MVTNRMPGVDWFLAHPKFSGFLACIAIALSFSPRSSMIGCWIAIAFAYVFLLSMLWSKKKFRKASALVLAPCLALFGWWLTGWRSDNYPALAGSIQQVADGHFPNKPDENLMLAVKVSNAGAPTTVSDWDLRVRIPDGTEYKTQPVYLPPGHNNISAQFPTFVQHWSGDDDLSFILAKKQIPKYGSEVGILAFTIPGLSAVSKGTKLTLRFKDEGGKGCKAEYVVAASSPQNLYVPGLAKP